MSRTENPQTHPDCPAAASKWFRPGRGWKGVSGPPSLPPPGPIIAPFSRKSPHTVSPIHGLCNKVSVLTQKRFLSQKALPLQKKSSALSEYCLCCEFLKIHPESQLISLFFAVSASPLRQPGPRFSGQRPQRNKKTVKKTKTSVINSRLYAVTSGPRLPGGQGEPQDPVLAEPRWVDRGQLPPPGPRP